VIDEPDQSLSKPRDVFELAQQLVEAVQLVDDRLDVRRIAQSTLPASRIRRSTAPDRNPSQGLGLGMDGGPDPLLLAVSLVLLLFGLLGIAVWHLSDVIWIILALCVLLAVSSVLYGDRTP